MNLISLICLLALSSSAFGRSPFSSYSAPEPTRDWNNQQRTVSSQLPTTNQVQSGHEQQANTYSSGSYGSQGESKLNFMGSRTISTVPEPTSAQQWSNAEMHCRGQRPGTIIPLDNGRRWVSCLEEEKAVEQSCPRSLFYNLESHRCERRAGQLENPCISQPCLNDGQCVPTDSSSFQCKCASGFDGTFCELDARVCQTQQPCGQAQGTRCQSFRSGAALQYICIHQNEFAYGFNAQQIQSSPCKNVDGTHPLAITEKGFVMCDGERMFVESCPGGTIWDDVNKACVWPDMQGLFGLNREVEQVKENNFGQQNSATTSPRSTAILPQQRTMVPTSNFGQSSMQRTMDPTSNFGQTSMQRSFEPTSNIGQSSMQRTMEPTSTYGQTPMQRSFEPTTNFGQTPMQRTMDPTSNFGQTSMQRSFEPTSNFGQSSMPRTFGSVSQQQPTSTDNQQSVQKPQGFVPVQQQLPKSSELRSFQPTSSY